MLQLLLRQRTPGTLENTLGFPVQLFMFKVLMTCISWILSRSGRYRTSYRFSHIPCEPNSQFLYIRGSVSSMESSGLVKLWWRIERIPLLMFKMYSSSSSLQWILPTFPSLYSNSIGRSSRGTSSSETGEIFSESDSQYCDVPFTSYRIGFLIWKEKQCTFCYMYFSTQIRFLIRGERVIVSWVKTL